MQFNLKLKGKVIALTFVVGVIPLLIAIWFASSRTSALLEDYGNRYMDAGIQGFAKLVDTCYKNQVLTKPVEARPEALNELKKTLLDEAAKMKFFETGYIIIFNSDGTCVYHPKTEYIGTKELYQKYDFAQKAIHQKTGVFNYEFGGASKTGALAYNQDLDWIMWSAAPFDEVQADAIKMKIGLYIFLVIVIIALAMVGLAISNRLASKANMVVERMRDIAQGEGDLTVRLPVLSTDEFGDLAHWFNEFMLKLEGVINKVKSATSRVANETTSVATIALDISKSTQEQASAIEEVAATIEQMSSSIKHNAENAQAGLVKTKLTVDAANNNATMAQSLSMAMDEISNASQKIGDIITTVNEVAFQTNLLALNAAVEAARAGEHGKGFAVVAEEVRALAQRSAEASKQIRSLIEDTVGKIKAGDDIAKKTEESLHGIASHIEELATTIDEIAAASAEQSVGVDELNRAISQIDSSTQLNAATVSDLSTTADSLNNEANGLAAEIGVFKTSSATLQIQAKPNKPTKSSTASAPRVQTKLPATAPASKPKSLPMIEDDFEEF